MSELDRLPRLSPARRRALQEVAQRKAPGYFLEGRKAIGDALANPAVRVREVWLAEDLEPAAALDLASAAAARPVFAGIARDADLAGLSDARSPQGALALIDDVARSVADVLAAARGPVILLDRVQDPGNVGAIFRAAAAFSAGGVLVSEGTADPLGAKALRASAGTVLSTRFARGSASDLLAAAAAAGFVVWLLEGGGTDVFSIRQRPARLVLAVGSEGSGASELVARAAQARVGIPISPAVESLNAAVAVGIAAAFLARAPVAPASRAREGR